MEDMPMRKTITALIAVASIATAVIAAPKSAEARCIGCWVGAGIAAGVVAGALASRSYGYGYPAYSYGYGYPAYGYAQPYGYYGGYYAPRRYYGRGYYRDWAPQTKAPAGSARPGLAASGMRCMSARMRPTMAE